MALVTVRRDTLTGQWMLTCAVCGRLGSMRDFWPASRMAAGHEVIHGEKQRTP